MAEGFRERAEKVNALLADSRSAFVLVTSPRADAVEEAGWFHHRLLDAGLPVRRASWRTACGPPVPKGDPSAELEELLGDVRSPARCCAPSRRSAAWPRRTAATWRRCRSAWAAGR